MRSLCHGAYLSSSLSIIANTCTRTRRVCFFLTIPWDIWSLTQVMQTVCRHFFHPEVMMEVVAFRPLKQACSSFHVFQGCLHRQRAREVVADVGVCLSGNLSSVDLYSCCGEAYPSLDWAGLPRGLGPLARCGGCRFPSSYCFVLRFRRYQQKMMACPYHVRARRRGLDACSRASESGRFVDRSIMHRVVVWCMLCGAVLCLIGQTADQ